MRSFSLLAFLAVVAAAEAANLWDQESSLIADTDVYGKILAIKEFSDNSIQHEAPRDPVFGLLGDSAVVRETPSERRANANSRVEGMLVQLNGQLSQQSEMMNSLGETASLNDGEAAQFAKILVRDPKKVAKTIRNVVVYLSHMLKDRTSLSPAQMDEARKWYVDTTAIVLGRYAYDETKQDMEGRGAAVDALRSRAESAEKSMDKIDADRHLHQMGADDLVKSSDIVPLLAKTGRLAAFLSEIESTESAPPTKNEDRKTLSLMESRESEITAAINQLMKKVQQGDPITGKVEPKMSLKGLPREARLKTQLMDAANKEDKARIVEAAGKVAEKKIMDDMKPLPAKPKAKPHNLSAPLSVLHSHVAQKINSQLDDILKLFQKRKTHHKSLSLAEHKNVNQQLRSITAMLMKKFVAAPKPHPVEVAKPEAPKLEAPKPTKPKAAMSPHNEKAAQLLASAFGMPLAKARKVIFKKTHQKTHVGLFGTPFDAPAKKKHKNISAGSIATMLKMPLKKAKKYLKTGKVPADVQKAEDKKAKQAIQHKIAVAKKGASGIATALKMPLSDAKNYLKKGSKAKPKATPKAKPTEKTAPVKPKAVAPKPANPVKQFVFHTLGNQATAQPTTLADLLKNGVPLMTGGILHFMAPHN